MNAGEQAAWDSLIHVAREMPGFAQKHPMVSININLVFAADDEFRLLRAVAEAAEKVLDVTVAATPDTHLMRVVDQIGALNRAWKAWNAACGPEEGVCEHID